MRRRDVLRTGLAGSGAVLVSGALPALIASPAYADDYPGFPFYLSASTAADLSYEGDVTIVNGGAAALTFRANADGSAHYTANVDAGGLVKLWRPGRDIATYATPIVQGRTYHLKVVAAGTRITVYLDRGATPVIDATDTAYSTGYLGANVFHGSGVVQNLNQG